MLFGRHFGLNRVVKHFGKFEINNVEFVDQEVAVLQSSFQLGFDVITHHFSFRDQFFGSEFGCRSLDGLLHGRIDDPILILQADLLVDLSDAVRIGVIVQGYHGVDGL